MDRSTSKKREAQSLAKSGAHAEAAELYSKLADEGQLEPYDLVVLGDLLNRCGNQDEGVTRYMQALDSYASSGLNRNAIALAKKVQRLVPEYYHAHRKLGDLYASEGLSSESCLHYLEYLDCLKSNEEVNPDDVQDVCLRLLELSLPSFDVIERVVKVAEGVDCAQPLAPGLMKQAERARTLGNPDAQESLIARAKTLDPNVQTEVISQEEVPQEPMIFDPGAVHFDAPPTDDGVISLDDVSLEADAPATSSEDESFADKGVLSFDKEVEPVKEVGVTDMLQDLEPVEDAEEVQEGEDVLSLDDAGSFEDTMADIAESQILSLDGDRFETEDSMPVDTREVDEAEGSAAEKEFVEAAELNGGIGDGEPGSPSLEIDISAGLDADKEAILDQGLAQEAGEMVETEGSGPSVDPDAARARGLEFLQNDEPLRAQREFMKAARAYFEQGLSPQAAELYERVVQMDPNHLEALRGMVEITHINGEKAKMAHWGCELGDVLLARELYSEAKYQFERVLAFDADNAKALSRVKRLKTMAGVKESGYGELTPTASEVEGAQVTVRDDKDESGQSVFDLSEILEEFRASVIEHIPAEDAGSHHDLGMTYMEMGLLQEAAQEFELTAQDEDHRNRSLEMLGECYRLLDRYQEAVPIFESFLVDGDDPAKARAHLNLGRCSEAMGEWDQAETHYYQALELDDGLTEAVELIESLERRREQGAA